jgi:transcriptional regulator with XRE-family HTH domain
MDERRRRQRELGALLRSHRNGLVPEDIGLQNGGARRTPGLRREEVAALSGIGVTWYSRLEMGQDVRPSRRTLRAIASVLRLDAATFEYALELAAQPGDDEPPAPESLRLSPGMSELFATPSGHGVLLFDAIRTALAWNAVAGGLLGYAPEPSWLLRNSIWRAFRTPDTRRLLGSGFGRIARELVSALRRNTMLAPSAATALLYEELHGEPLFADAWKNHQSPAALRGMDEPYALDHPVHGLLPVYVLISSVRIVPHGLLMHWIPGSPKAVRAFDDLARTGRAFVAENVATSER